MNRADFMSAAQARAVRRLPRTHQNMKQALEHAELHPVGRPGKTACDRARKFPGGAR